MEACLQIDPWSLQLTSKVRGSGSLIVITMMSATSNDVLDMVAGATVMTVWAHPDDESFLAGGLMVAAAARGARLINVSATLGELGTDDPATWTPEVLGARRKSELDAALALLGEATLETLGVQDGSCETLDDRMGARLVGTMVERHRPDVVITFGPDGVTGHPDHQAVGRWTNLAVASLAPGVPVLHAVTACAWPAELIEPMHEVGAFFPGYPDRRTSDDDCGLELDDSTLDRKLAALECHASQIGPLRDRLGSDGYRHLFRFEAYRPANAAALGWKPARRRLVPVA